MPQSGQVMCGRFLLRVRRGPAGRQWQIEDLETGDSSCFDVPHEILAFIRAHLVEKEQDAPMAGEAE